MTQSSLRTSFPVESGENDKHTGILLLIGSIIHLLFHRLCSPGRRGLSSLSFSSSLLMVPWLLTGVTFWEFRDSIVL